MTNDAVLFLRELADAMESERLLSRNLFAAAKGLTGQNGHIWHPSGVCTPECAELRAALAAIEGEE